MTTYFSPLVRFSVAKEGLIPVEFGKVVLRLITDEELLGYFHISDRRFGPSPGEVGFKRHWADIPSGGQLNELQEVALYKSRYGFFSTTLEAEEHQKIVNDVLHCCRLLTTSLVSSPITLHDSGPGSFSNRPLECRLGKAFILTQKLVDETKRLFKNIKKVQQADLDLIDLANAEGYNALAVLFLVTIAERSLLKKTKMSSHLSSLSMERD